METVAEKIILGKEPANRQVIANIGNRYVVFGKRANLPGGRDLGPGDVRRRFTERVTDEYDFPRERLAQSVVVDGVEVSPASDPADDHGDIVLSYPDGSTSLVKIAIGSGPPASREATKNYKWIGAVGESGLGSAEVWTFDIEHIRLNIASIDMLGGWRSDDLAPLNVWEFNFDGTIFPRSQVVEGVDEWERRINEIYADVEAWCRDLGLELDRSRTLSTSEDFMQKFAVPDRDLQILDIDHGGQALISFVPISFWMTDAWGRIDVISRRGTTILLNLARPNQRSDWKLRVNGPPWGLEPWNRDSFLKLLETAEAA